MNNKYIVQAMNEIPNHIDDLIDCGGYDEEEVKEYNTSNCYD